MAFRSVAPSMPHVSKDCFRHLSPNATFRFAQMHSGRPAKQGDPKGTDQAGGTGQKTWDEITPTWRGPGVLGVCVPAPRGNGHGHREGRGSVPCLLRSPISSNAFAFSSAVPLVSRCGLLSLLSLLSQRIWAALWRSWLIFGNLARLRVRSAELEADLFKVLKILKFHVFPNRPMIVPLCETKGNLGKDVAKWRGLLPDYSLIDAIRRP